jgi:hypothetical protein
METDRKIFCSSKNTWIPRSVQLYLYNNNTYIFSEYKKSEILLKKRRKHGVEDAYPEYYN